MTDLERADALLYALLTEDDAPRQEAMLARALAAARREGEAALADARGERDAYMRSYADACAERDRARREGAEAMRERATNDRARENIERVIRRCFGAYDQANGVPEEVVNRAIECIRALPLTPEEPT